MICCSFINGSTKAWNVYILKSWFCILLKWFSFLLLIKEHVYLVNVVKQIREKMSCYRK